MMARVRTKKRGKKSNSFLPSLSSVIREFIGFCIEKANVYYYRIGGEVSKSLL